MSTMRAANQLSFQPCEDQYCRVALPPPLPLPRLQVKIINEKDKKAVLACMMRLCMTDITMTLHDMHERNQKAI